MYAYFFGYLRVNVKPRIVSSLQDMHIEFAYDTLANILGISNKGPRVFEIKIIPIIDGFVYNEAIILHIGSHDFAPRAKIKSQDLLL